MIFEHFAHHIQSSGMPLLEFPLTAPFSSVDIAATNHNATGRRRHVLRYRRIVPTHHSVDVFG